MCGETPTGPEGEQSRQATNEHGEDSALFPWHLGVYDAHCHPTDTMASIASIAGMKARLLTVMATRSQDQELVSSVASTHGVHGREALQPNEKGNASTPTDGKVVPSFGWHPWFSHQLVDDTSTTEAEDSPAPTNSDPLERKARHYNSVLSPSPAPDAFIRSLPDPRPLSAFLSTTRANLLAHPLALVGEIGLDKAFRLPDTASDHQPTNTSTSSDGGSDESGLTPGGREGRLLSPFRVAMPHQVAVLRAQLRLAGELGRAVSVHGVQAHGVLLEALAATWSGHEAEVVSNRQRRRHAPAPGVAEEDFSDTSSTSSGEESAGEQEDGVAQREGDGTNRRRQKKQGERGEKTEAKQPQPKPYPPRICLHSFSGPAAMLKQYLNPAIPVRIFFSFSTAVNCNCSRPGDEAKFAEVVRACPDDQLLVESDLHTAGPRMDAALEDMYRRVCAVKGWSLEDGVTRIGRNYEAFVFG